MKRRPARLAMLLALTVCAAHATQNRVEDPEGDATPAVYPFSAARMYDMPRDQLWNAVVAFLEQQGFGYAQFDHKSGLIITKPRRVRWKKFQYLERFELPDGYTPYEFELHIFIPRRVPVARLHINSLVESRNGGATRFTFSSGHIERAIYDVIEKKLRTPPIAIPKDHDVRKALMGELAPEDACRESPVFQTLFGSPPTLISESKVSPVFPGNDQRARREGQVVLRVLVDEAGVVSRIELPSGSPPRTEFEITAWSTMEFWRFEPAERDGCPVASYFSVFVEFRFR